MKYYKNKISKFLVTEDIKSDLINLVGDIKSGDPIKAASSALKYLASGGFLRMEDVFIETHVISGLVGNNNLSLTNIPDTNLSKVHINERNTEICSLVCKASGINTDKLMGCRIWIPHYKDYNKCTAVPYSVFVYDNIAYFCTGCFVEAYKLTKNGMKYLGTYWEGGDYIRGTSGGDRYEVSMIIGAIWYKDNSSLSSEGSPSTTIVLDRTCAPIVKPVKDYSSKVSHGWKPPHVRRAYMRRCRNGKVRLIPMCIVNGGRPIKQTTIVDELRHARDKSDIPAEWV